MKFFKWQIVLLLLKWSNAKIKNQAKKWVRSRDPEIKTDTSQLIQSKKLINDHTRGKSYTICEEKNLSANAMERDQWSIIRLKTWTNHLPVADSVRRIEICMGRSRVERLQHVEGRPDVSEWEGSQNKQAKLHFLKRIFLRSIRVMRGEACWICKERVFKGASSTKSVPRENLAFERSS